MFSVWYAYEMEYELVRAFYEKKQAYNSLILENQKPMINEGAQAFRMFRIGQSESYLTGHHQLETIL